jgi:hypothetical protein
MGSARARTAPRTALGPQPLERRVRDVLVAVGVEDPLRHCLVDPAAAALLVSLIESGSGIGQDGVGFVGELLGEAAAGDRHERGEVDEPPDGPTRRDERDRHAAQGMADQHELLALVRERPHHAVGVGLKRRRRVLTGKIDRDHPMPTCLELGRQALKAPRAVPRPMDQREGGHGHPPEPRTQRSS